MTVLILLIVLLLATTMPLIMLAFIAWEDTCQAEDERFYAAARINRRRYFARH